MFLIQSCTGAVAPEGAPTSKSRTEVLEKKTETLAKAAVITQSPSPTPSPVEDPPADDTVMIPKGNPLGTIATEDGDLFTAAAAYGLYNGTGTYKSLIIAVTENDDRDTKFKKVLSWKCYTCALNDPRCTETVPTNGIYYLTFTKPVADPPAGSGVVAAATATGFPNKTPITLSGNAGDDSYFNTGFAVSLRSAPTVSGHKGTVTFQKKPAAVGDTFEMMVDLTFGNGKKHSATISGTVYENPVGSAEKPAGCDAAGGKFGVPTYE